MKSLVLLVFGLFLVGCNDFETPKQGLPDQAISKLIPKRVKDRQSWASDIGLIFDELKLIKNTQNVCTVIAVIDQESNFQADPVVSNLGAISLKALDDKLESKLGKLMAQQFRAMLKTRPDTTNSFERQIKAVKTEQQLDRLYQRMFDYFSQSYNLQTLTQLTKLTGETIEERLNPITTLGSMQVHIDYAKNHRRARMDGRALRSDMYGQYGGLYYGIHRLMMYQADYDKPLYRFADYNSGVYSSRNAAFQERIGALTAKKLALDGDLLLYESGDISHKVGQTEQLLIELLATGKTPLTQIQIRHDLKKEKTQSFEETQTYQIITHLYEQQGKKFKYAIMPQVDIKGPKLKQTHNTNWFANQVNKRYQTCTKTAKQLGLS